MPTEDQLTRGERIRLEALSQAQAMAGQPTNEAEGKAWVAQQQAGEMIFPMTEENILARAERIEGWLKRADEDARTKGN